MWEEDEEVGERRVIHRDGSISGCFERRGRGFFVYPQQGLRYRYRRGKGGRAVGVKLTGSSCLVCVFVLFLRLSEEKKIDERPQLYTVRLVGEKKNGGNKTLGVIISGVHYQPAYYVCGRTSSEAELQTPRGRRGQF